MTTVYTGPSPLTLVANLGLPLGLPGATAAGRFVGATATGAPTTGTFLVGDFVVDQTGALWVCTVAGTPGTWVESGTSIGGNITLAEGNNIIVGTATGTKIGTATTQKLGFFNATPVVQPAGTVDVLASLVTLGLRAASSNPPLNLGTGALTAGTGSVIGNLTLTTSTVTSGGDLNLVSSNAAGNVIVSPRNSAWSATFSDVGLDLSTMRLTVGNLSLNTVANVISSSSDFYLKSTNAGGVVYVVPNNNGGTPYTFAATLLTLADAVNMAVGSGTGHQIATATTQKLGFYGAAPIAQRAGAAQAAVVTTPSALASYGYTQAQADSIVTLVNELRAWAVSQGFIKGAA